MASTLSIGELIKPFQRGPDKGQFRLKMVIDKIADEDPFRTARDGDKILFYKDETIEKAITSYDFKTLSTMTRGAKGKWFVDAEGNEYSASALSKTPQFGGGGGSGASVDPHEIMTGAIILKYGATGKTFPQSKINKYSSDTSLCTKDIEDLKSFGSKVNGSKQVEVDSFDNDYQAFAQAISAANGFLEHLKSSSKVKEVYATGSKWAKEISKFAVKDHPLMKGAHYNSADLVVKVENGNGVDWIGISLKKKALGPKEADPTVINKTIVGMDGLFRKLVGQGSLKNKDIHQIYNQRSIFFANVVKKTLSSSNPTIKNRAMKIYGLKTQADIQKFIIDKIDKPLKKGGNLNEGKKILKLAQSLGQDNMTNALQRKYPDDSLVNNYFIALDQLMTRPTLGETFVMALTNIIFKTDLTKLLTAKNLSNFHFTLITGKGHYKIGEFRVEKAHELQEAYTSEILSEMISTSRTKKNMRVEKTKGKRQAFEGGPAKLFYTLYFGNFDLADLEIRYKGSITAEPQFFAVITSTFKSKYDKFKREIKSGKSSY